MAAVSRTPAEKIRKVPQESPVEIGDIFGHRMISVTIELGKFLRAFTPVKAYRRMYRAWSAGLARAEPATG